MSAPGVAPDRPLRVVVVDDEPLARADVVQLLAERDDCEVVATCANGVEALAAVEQHTPDVLLLDIRMPAIDGFGVVDGLTGPSKPYVVFVTAHDEYAIEAFRVRALDYLLKPVQGARLSEALSRAREHRPQLPREYLTQVVVRAGNRDIVVRVTDVDWVEADTYYARLHVRGGSYLLRERMHVLARRLDPAHFARVHRSAIVNISRVSAVEHNTRGDHTIVLSTGARVRTSHQRWTAFRDRLRAQNPTGVSRDAVHR